jgi:hypothetical protein
MRVSAAIVPTSWKKEQQEQQSNSIDERAILDLKNRTKFGDSTVEVSNDC